MTKTVCGTGHRPNDLPAEYGYNYNSDGWRAIISRIKRIVTKNNVDVVITGMALGFDTALALAVLELKDEGSSVELWAYVPCKNQEKMWVKESQELYQSILKRCDKIKIISEVYTRECMLERNKRMVDDSRAVIALYNGKTHGGTYHCVNYAQKKNRKILNLYK